jgi:hypothetical protein
MTTETVQGEVLLYEASSLHTMMLLPPGNKKNHLELPCDVPLLHMIMLSPLAT